MRWNRKAVTAAALLLALASSTPVQARQQAGGYLPVPDDERPPTPTQAGPGWRLVFSPPVEVGIAAGHDEPVPGTWAGVLFKAGGTALRGGAKAAGAYAWPPIKTHAAAGAGGSFYEYFLHSGQGQGHAEMKAHLGLEVDAQAAHGGAGQAYAWMEVDSNVLDRPLEESAQVAVSTDGADDLAGVSVVTPKGAINLPMQAGGSLSVDDPPPLVKPTNDTQGGQDTHEFWRKHRTYGYMDVQSSGTVTHHGSCRITFEGALDSAPVLTTIAPKKKQPPLTPIPPIDIGKLRWVWIPLGISLLPLLFNLLDDLIWGQS